MSHRLRLPSRGRAWCLLVFALACPALASPLLYAPLPCGQPAPVWFVGVVVPTLSSPRLWASAATLVAILGARRLAEAPSQERRVATLVLLSWFVATETLVREGLLF